MRKFRLVATDIDGTLANSEGELSARTVDVLRRLLDDGVPVALVTGLNPWPVRRYVEQIGHGIRAISLNGIFLLEDKKVHEGKFLAPTAARRAASLIADAGYVPQVYGQDLTTRYLPVEAGMSVMESLMASRPYQPYAAVSTVDALFDVAPAQVALCDVEPRARQVYTLLEQALGTDVYLVLQPGAHSWVEINHPEARKDTALVRLAQRMDVAPDEIVYFGDSLNDRVVFERLPYCVAVGNARPEIKPLAWRSAPTNDEDGVARTLQTLFELD
jgi:hydroxymethylpyrimidine pyrophosphatase-like HAD family hydrolase